MAVLEVPSVKKTIPLPGRTAIIGGEADVLVVGGGFAGVGAALGAAQAGVRVILAEQYGYPGGQATAGLVSMLATYHTQSPLTAGRTLPPEFYPRDHGPGRPVIAGAVAALVNRLIQADGAVPPSLETGYTVVFDPETFKWVATEMLDEAGVKFLFHALASGVVGHTRPEGVVFESKSGPVVIRADTIVDCTGDGDVAVWSGAPFAVGRRDDFLTQPMTLYFRMVDFDRRAFAGYVHDHPGEWNGVSGLKALIRQAVQAGDLELSREDILFFSTPHSREVSLNCTRVFRTLGTNVWDLSYAEWQSRKQMRQIAVFLKKYVPGFEKAYVVQSGVSVGVRETRRILGDYVLTGEDVERAHRFDDAIAHATYPIDIHSPLGQGTVLRKVPFNEAYDIPLRCLIPLNTENLLVAGRCISADHEALASCRVMPISMATGQAAGVTAALAVLQGKTPREVPACDVQKSLRLQKAYLRPGLCGG